LGLDLVELENGIVGLDFPWLHRAKFPNRKAFDYPWPETSPFVEDSELPKPRNLPEELTVNYWFTKNKVYSHPNSAHYFKPKRGYEGF
jgi:DNA (cytosine-5)-methyltransferase 1